MSDKHYNLTEKPNANGQDIMPEWMEKVFEKKDKPNDDYKQLFEKPKPVAKKCECCGNILKVNEIKVCGNCI